MTPELSMYLCPRRKISFDGFVSYEGRRFGVPYWYSGKACRVNRDGGHLHIYSDDNGPRARRPRGDVVLPRQLLRRPIRLN